MASTICRDQCPAAGLLRTSLGGSINLADGHRPIERVQRGLVDGVDARHAAQRNCLRLPQVLGIDLVLLVQIAGKTDSRGGHAAHQRDVLLLAFFKSQFKAVLPIADRLATA